MFARDIQGDTPGSASNSPSEALVGGCIAGAWEEASTAMFARDIQADTPGSASNGPSEALMGGCIAGAWEEASARGNGRPSLWQVPNL